MTENNHAHPLVNDEWDILDVTSISGSETALQGETVSYTASYEHKDPRGKGGENYIRWQVIVDRKEITLSEQGETIELEMKQEWKDKEILVMAKGYFGDRFDEKKSQKTWVGKKIASSFVTLDEDTQSLPLADINNEVYILENDLLPITIKREEINGELQISIISANNQYIEFYENIEEKTAVNNFVLQDSENEKTIYLFGKKMGKEEMTINIFSELEEYTKEEKLKLVVFGLTGEREVFDCNRRKYKFYGLPHSAQWQSRVIGGEDITTIEEFNTDSKVANIQWKKGEKEGKLFLKVQENYIYPIKINIAECPCCTDWKTVPSLIPKDKFVPYGRTGNCRTAAQKQIEEIGYTTVAETGWHNSAGTGISSYIFQLYLAKDIKFKENNEMKKGVQKEKFYEGVKYVKESLGIGKPVVVGVEYGKINKTAEPNADFTTDHYVVIVGMGTSSDGKKYFQFYDNAARTIPSGTSEYNRLYCNCHKPAPILESLESDCQLSENTFISSREWKMYVVSQIRKTKKKN